jgi:hypothetical protein
MSHDQAVPGSGSSYAVLPGLLQDAAPAAPRLSRKK